MRSLDLMHFDMNIDLDVRPYNLRGRDSGWTVYRPSESLTDTLPAVREVPCRHSSASTRIVGLYIDTLICARGLPNGHRGAETGATSLCSI